MSSGGSVDFRLSLARKRRLERNRIEFLLRTGSLPVSRTGPHDFSNNRGQHENSMLVVFVGSLNSF